MIVDASAVVAILVREPEAEALLERLEQQPGKLRTHPISVWEAALAVARASRITIPEAHKEVLGFLATVEIEIVPIDATDTLRALVAAETYGRGTGHAANLNLGDCFTYSLAMRYGGPILFKGDDFTHTLIGQQER